MRRMILRKITAYGLFYIWIIVGICFLMGCASTKNEMSIKETQRVAATGPCKEYTQEYSDEHDKFTGEEKGVIGKSEEEAFERAILIATKQRLRTFMESYPESRYVQEVEDRIQWLEQLKVGIILTGFRPVEEMEKIKAHLGNKLEALFGKYGGRAVFLENADEAKAQELSLLVEMNHIYYGTNPERARRVGGAVARGVILGGVLGGLIEYGAQKHTFGPPNKTVDYWLITMKSARLASEYEKRKDFQNLDEMFASCDLFSEIRKAETLTWIREREEPPAGFLKVIFKNNDSSLRMEVIKTLGDIQKPPMDLLTHALKDKDSSVRYEAASVLGKIKDVRGMGPLMAALNDEDPNVRWIAGKALEDITGQNFGKDPIKWQEWWEENKPK